MPTAWLAMPMRPPSSPTERDAQALALFAQPVGGRHAAVLEHDLRRVAGVLAQLVLDARHRVARRVGGHDEGADALLARGLVGDRHDDGHVAVLAAGDELLDAVEHVLVALSPLARRAVVRRPPASEPTCGSVRQKAPSISPRASGTRKRCCWSSLPKAIRMEQTGQLLTLTMVLVAPSAGGDLLQDERQRQVVQPGAVLSRPARPRRSSPAGQAAQRGRPGRCGACPRRRHAGPPRPAR
jgi:hypothetical protein